MSREFSLGYELESLDIGFGQVRLLVDGKLVATGERVPTAPMGYTNLGDGLQVGRCRSTSMASRHFLGFFPFAGSLMVVELRTDLSSQLRRTNYVDPGDERPQPSAAKTE